MQDAASGDRMPLATLFAKFLRFGAQAWGGPIAQIAMMHRHLVEEEHWIDDAKFRRVLGVYQALPGPEATELAVYFGVERRGRLGGFLSGLAFVLPGFLLTLLVAALYVRYGAHGYGVAGILYAVKPVVIALILSALVRLTKASLVNEGLVMVALATATAAWILPLNFFVVVGATSVVYAVARRRSAPAAAAGLMPGLFSLASMPLLVVAFLFFLGAGLLTFGGAYTAIPFLEEGAVRHFGWITPAQFLDAVALCALLPAPLVIIATFIGFLVAGLPGAIVATVGIFLPAFAITLLGHQRLVRLVENPDAHDLMEGVTAAVVGLVAVTAVHLAATAFPDPLSIVIGVAAFVAARFLKINVALVVLGAALLGVGLDVAGYV